MTDGRFAPPGPWSHFHSEILATTKRFTAFAMISTRSSTHFAKSFRLPLPGTFRLDNARWERPFPLFCGRSCRRGRMNAESPARLPFFVRLLLSVAFVVFLNGLPYAATRGNYGTDGHEYAGFPF